MIASPVTLLQVEADAVDAKRIRDVLAGVQRPAFHVESVSLCADALARLEEGAMDVVLLDLMLPDAQGFEVF